MYAIRSYYAFKTFILPKPTDANFEYWMSSDGEKLTGGSSAKNDFITYTAKIPYTLTSDDVVVTNGYIVSCSYSFEKKYITIPSTRITSYNVCYTKLLRIFHNSYFVKVILTHFICPPMGGFILDTLMLTFFT